MLEGIRRHLTYANVVSSLALFLVLSGGLAWAVATIGPSDIQKNAVRSKHIKQNAVKAKQIKTGAVASPEILDGSVGEQDLDVDLPTPDTPSEVLNKVKGVDGPGSGLDADFLDGVSSGALVRRGPSTEGVGLATDLQWWAYRLNIFADDLEYDFDEVSIFVGIPNDEFFLCQDTTGTVNWIMYKNGVRTIGSITAGGCTSAFAFANGDDFEIILDGVEINMFQEGFASQFWTLYGYSQES